MTINIPRISCRKNSKFALIVLLIFVLSIFLLFQYTDNSTTFTLGPKQLNLKQMGNNSTKIIVITPTYKRYTRIADMLRMSNTLRLVPNIHWILIEDGNEKSTLLEHLLERSQIPNTYLVHKTAKGYPKRGWYQRDMALTYLRQNYKQITKGYKHAVVFFGDDDNSYDTRLFTDYMTNVKKVGIWAVGHVGGALFESPRVKDGKVVGWNVRWKPSRPFATDMAGFAISLQCFLDYPNALFGKSCKRGSGAPEPCLLEDLHLTKEDLEPFGFDNPPEKSREILVYHTKTTQPKKYPKQDLHGFEIETI